MNYKRTEDLLKQLTLSDISYEKYIAENEDAFIVTDLNEFWKNTIEKSKMAKIDIINNADIGYTYFYNIVRGKSVPARDTVVKLFLAMQLSLAECQEALKLFNWAPLYPKKKRDSILIYALSHGLSLYETADMLDFQGEKGFRGI